MHILNDTSMHINDFMVTRTDSRSGDVLYRCTKEGLPPPMISVGDHSEGLEFEIIAGTGCETIVGRKLVDSRKNINDNIKNGVSRKLNLLEAEEIDTFIKGMLVVPGQVRRLPNVFKYSQTRY